MRTLFYTISINYEPSTVTLPIWREKAYKNGAEFKIIDKHHYPADLSPIYNKYKGPQLFPDFDRYIYFDADTIPGKLFNIEDFFLSGHPSVARDLFGLRWVQQGVEVFKSLIPDLKFKYDNNWNSGVFAYDSSFFPFFKKYDEWVTLSSASIVASIRDAGSKGIFVGKEQTLTNLYSALKSWPMNYLEPMCNVVHAKTRFAGYSSAEVYHHSSIVHMNDFRSSQEIIDFVESMRPYF